MRVSARHAITNPLLAKSRCAHRRLRHATVLVLAPPKSRPCRASLRSSSRVFLAAGALLLITYRSESPAPPTRVSRASGARPYRARAHPPSFRREHIGGDPLDRTPTADPGPEAEQLRLVRRPGGARIQPSRRRSSTGMTRFGVQVPASASPQNFAATLPTSANLFDRRWPRLSSGTDWRNPAPGQEYGSTAPNPVRLGRRSCKQGVTGSNPVSGFRESQRARLFPTRECPMTNTQHIRDADIPEHWTWETPFLLAR
jgi:hypothetical protein